MISVEIITKYFSRIKNEIVETYFLCTAERSSGTNYRTIKREFRFENKLFLDKTKFQKEIQILFLFVILVMQISILFITLLKFSKCLTELLRASNDIFYMARIPTECDITQTEILILMYFNQLIYIMQKETLSKLELIFQNKFNQQLHSTFI